MHHYSYVFIILVYKNTDDLKVFFKNFAVPNSKVIVVNSFYNNDTDICFRNIANENSAIYLSVPNRGYGAGNNAGCEYALKNFVFDYLVITNPDIYIKSYLPPESLPVSGIIAPSIVTATGKRQNPYSIFNNKFVDTIKYYALNSKYNICRYLYYGLIRLTREIFLFYTSIFKNKVRCVARAHGAHLIVARTSLEQMSPMFNEDMFLFCEEEHLSKLAKSKGIPIYYIDQIHIIHNEDGSVGVSNVNIRKEIQKSYNIFYNYWYSK